MIVVSNTSPITNLAAIDQLLLLRSLYDEILIPDAVFGELTEVATPVPGTEAVQTLGWIQTRQVADRQLVASLMEILDPGEAEAIALALEINADLLLLDERRGYQIATQMNLCVLGVLGVLLAAKARQLVPTVQPLLDQLISRAGFWVGLAVYRRTLELAGELVDEV